MKKYTFLILAVFLLANCLPKLNNETGVPSPSSTPAPTVATSTSAPTATSTIMPTSTPRGALTEKCTKILPAFPEGNIPPGTLVIRPPGELSLLNFRQKTQRSIPGQFYGAGTSPTGGWLSYVIFTTETNADVKEELIIESADGQRYIQLPFESEWLVFDWLPWLDNEQLWFPVRVKSDANLPMVVLNPFTGERQVLLPDYPDFTPFLGSIYAQPLHFGYSNVVYDPSLRFVVYPQGQYFALWDRENKQTVVKIPSKGLYGPLPLWMPDGNSFLLAAGLNEIESKDGRNGQNIFSQQEFDRRAGIYKNTPKEWLMVNRDGKITQLTHFGNFYSQLEFGLEASLSPDGHYLAFGLDNDSSFPRLMELVILNLQTFEVINTCITFSYFPFWSPDSQYLAVQYLEYDENLSKDTTSVLVINPKQNWAVTVFTDNKENNYRTSPQGWLDSGE